MAERHRTCDLCGKQFSYRVSRGADRRLCSKECVIASKKIAQSKRKELLNVCSVDGCLSPANRTSAGLCETHYYRIRRNGSLSTLVDKSIYSECQHCGKQTNGSKFCSARCASRHSRGCDSQKKCVNCGAMFTPTNAGKDKVTCSLLCEQEHSREYARSYYARKMKSDPLFVDKVRGYEFKRKTIKLSAFVEDVSRDYVMARDKWTCHLCKEKIPKNAAWPDRLFGTLDHVMPLNKGGKHSYANIKAAHLTCNCSKNDKIIGQLGLEFA